MPYSTDYINAPLTWQWASPTYTASNTATASSAWTSVRDCCSDTSAFPFWNTTTVEYGNTTTADTSYIDLRPGRARIEADPFGGMNWTEVYNMASSVRQAQSDVNAEEESAADNITQEEFDQIFEAAV